MITNNHTTGSALGSLEVPFTKEIGPNFQNLHKFFGRQKKSSHTLCQNIIRILSSLIASISLLWNLLSWPFVIHWALSTMVFQDPTKMSHKASTNFFHIPPRKPHGQVCKRNSSLPAIAFVLVAFYYCDKTQGPKQFIKESLFGPYNFIVWGRVAEILGRKEVVTARGSSSHFKLQAVKRKNNSKIVWDLKLQSLPPVADLLQAHTPESFPNNSTS